MTQPRVFISYRRSDGLALAGRIADTLRSYLPEQNVFLDIEDIEVGDRFKDVISARIAMSDYVIVCIGRNWEGAEPQHSRRIDLGDDFVRYEIERALNSKKRVLPVLLEGATMPTAVSLPAAIRELAHLHAIPLTHIRFASEMASVLQALGISSPARHASEGRLTRFPELLLSFGGSISQGAYWMGMAAIFLATIGLYALLVPWLRSQDIGYVAEKSLFYLAIIPLMVSTLALAVKRGRQFFLGSILVIAYALLSALSTFLDIGGYENVALVLTASSAVALIIIGLVPGGR